MADTVIAFKALHLANEQRSAYGLRYSDFERYRKHCANRTHRLRSTLKMTHGKGREFKPLPVVATEKIKAEHLELLLLEAERAWSYSLELLAIADKPNRQQANNAKAVKQSAKSRFRRAVHWSTQLLSQCQRLHANGRLSAESLLQAHVYVLILNGRWLRHRFAFEDAVVQLCVAKGLLDQLADTATTSRDQALAVCYSDDISPEIRYCAHELGRAKAYDVDGIVAELAPIHRNGLVDGYDALVKSMRNAFAVADANGGNKKLQQLIWDGEPVPIRNPELVDVLLRIQEAEAKLGGQSIHPGAVVEHAAESKPGKAANPKKGVAAYDSVLAALSDAEEIARKLTEAHKLSRPSSTTQAGSRDINFIHAYIVHQLLSRRIQRDLLLLSALLSQPSAQTTKRQTSSATAAVYASKQVDSRLYPALVKLLDAIMQSLIQMRTLSIVDDHPDLTCAVEARISFSKAQRYLYLSYCYTPSKRFPEALTLLQHASIHLREARSTAMLADGEFVNSGVPLLYPLDAADFDRMEADITATALQSKKDWFAYNGGLASVSAVGYQKPLFFNIALNYVQLDVDRLQERAGIATEGSLSQVILPTLERPKPDESVQGQRKALATKVEEALPSSPVPSQAPARGGLSTLLGGWWGRS